MTGATGEVGATTGSLPTVLFVDDEEGLLAGLRSTLRKHRHEYRFLFAHGGDEALAILDGEPVDVMVTDMRMPGMNGADLLKEVKARYPEVVRYVLSGEADKQLLLQAIPVTQRWLTKPISQEELLEALAEAVRHRALLGAPDILAILGRINALPSPPPLYRALVTLLDDPRTTVDEIAELITGDAAASAKLLQWANSALASGSRVDDVRTAVVRLGFNMVSYLVLSAELVRRLDPLEAIPGVGVNALSHHLRLVSGLAAALADRPEGLVAATAGGLIEIGLLLEASHLPDRVDQAYRYAEERGLTLVAAEAELYGLTYCEIGGHLLSVWGLPSPLVLAVEGAHQMPAPAPAPLRAAEAVRAARLAAQQLDYFGAFGDPHRDPVDPELEPAITGWLAALGDDDHPGGAQPLTAGRPVAAGGSSRG